jgi:Cellulase (glycosyl hydrolase family 5)
MMKIQRLVAIVGLYFIVNFATHAQQSVWSVEKANAWYQKQGWILGANYLPITAINQLEMFQKETFDVKTIDKELALAASIGMNTMRIFLHDILWKQDKAGFKLRLNTLLSLCAKHNIKPILVFFDSCWNPFPHTGKQHAPVSGLHNSGWVQSPGADILTDEKQWPLLENYVKDIIASFKNDSRILAWDVWNEPDNTNGSSYSRWEPMNKIEQVNKLLPKIFQWARSQNPSQPLTSGVWVAWKGSWHKDSSHTYNATEKIQFANSDIISFHSYQEPKDFEEKCVQLTSFGRPIICTEYLARGLKNTPITVLPMAKKYNIGMVNWGFADGKDQTKYPWDSWDKSRYTKDPELWHHLLFNADYTPYIKEEIDFFKQMAGKK